MSSLREIKDSALKLNSEQRASLASSLLASLPNSLESEDDGVAEAMTRDRELDASPEIGLTLTDLRNAVSR